jgi:mono/diheme cytochrome c family protein
MRGETPSALGFRRASGGQSQPMNPVSGSLGAAAIALALLTAGCGEDPREERMALGKEVYARECSRCHLIGGQGFQGVYPNLRHDPIVELDSPEAVVETVLNGRESMPAFGGELPEQKKIAAVITRLERGGLRRAGRRRTAELEVGGVLAGLFAVYLIWSIPPALAGTAVC